MRTHIAIVFFLFIMPISSNALADCAWILWHDLQTVAAGDSSGPKEWTVMATAKTFELCTEQQEKASATFFEDVKNNNAKIHAFKGTVSRKAPIVASRRADGAAS